MANIFLITNRSRRATKSKNAEGKRSNSNSNSGNNFSCKKHTKHSQSPGICSLCLSEKLSKLSMEYYEYTTSSSKSVAETTSSCCSSSSHYSSISSYGSSSSVSSCSSPLQYRYREKKNKNGKKQGLFRLLLGSIVD